MPIRFQASPDVVTREVPEGAILVNIQTGFAFKLNRVGLEVWRLLDGKRGLDEIIGDLQSTYAVDAERLQRDVEVLLDDLRKQGLVGVAKDR